MKGLNPEVDKRVLEILNSNNTSTKNDETPKTSIVNRKRSIQPNTEGVYFVLHSNYDYKYI